MKGFNPAETAPTDKWLLIYSSSGNLGEYIPYVFAVGKKYPDGGWSVGEYEAYPSHWAHLPDPAAIQELS